MTAEIDPTVPPSGDGCLECDESGGWWFHLRRGAACGHVGCCDQSLSRHARAHAAETGHPIIRSYEPGEDWFYDFRTDDYAESPELAPPESHPVEQTMPGPAERVPANWQQQLMRR